MQPHPFTISFQGRVNCVCTECFVADFQTDSSMMMNCNAIWDTGAFATVISKRIVSFLNLQPDGQVEMYHADGKSKVYTYTINLKLPNGVLIQGLHISAADLIDIDVLIGMDIITLCDIAITNAHSNTKFSFQIPSCLDIDFESQKQRLS